MTVRRYYRQIVIRYISVPRQEDNADADIDYLYQCLGLGDERDEVGRMVFRALVKTGKEGKGISSAEIMRLSEVSQAAIIYHLNIFMRSGLVVKEGRNYVLRGYSLDSTLAEMENDMHRRFENLREIARRIEKRG